MSKKIVAIVIFARKWIGGPYNYSHHGSNITVLYDDKSEADYRVKPTMGKEYLATAFELLAKEFVLNIPAGYSRHKYLEEMGINLIVGCTDVNRRRDL